MKLSARIISGVAAVALAVSVAQPAHANLDAFLDTMELAKDDWLILTSEYGRDGHHSQLSIQPGRAAEGETRGEWIQCSSFDDPDCQGTEALKRITANSILPDCSITAANVCLESFKIGKIGQELKPATYVGEVSRDADFAANPSVNLLQGAGLPLYENQTGTSVSTTDKFAVMVSAEAFWNFDTKKFRISRLEAKVIPYQISAGVQLTLGCAFIVQNQCAEIQDFDPETLVELKFNVPNDIGGWFSGRMKAPNISVAKFNAKHNTIKIAAEPVEVAALGLVKNAKDFTATENNFNENHGKWSVGNGQWASGANSWQPDVFPFIENYRKQVNDTSIGSNRVWSFMSIGPGNSNPCLTDKSKVLGIVTTNALGYAGESPEFKNGFLNYKVAGLHYESDGKNLVQGTYDLVMRSETARCLYGFSNAPLSASVSVTNDRGTKTTATTVVSEKSGWLKMAAYGFTFSKKTIKVKITKKVVKKK